MRLHVSDVPHLAQRWASDLNNDSEASFVGAGSRKVYWWRCQDVPDHVWESSPHDLSKRCPICHPRRPSLPQSLKGLYPEIANEIDRTVPDQPNGEDLLPQSNKKLWWRCQFGHLYQATVQQRTKHHRQCPECLSLALVPDHKRGKRLSIAYNLASEYPDIADELHRSLNGDITAAEVSPKTSKKYYWQCSRNSNHVWQTSVSNRTRLGSNCPYCFNQTSRGELRVFSEIKSVFTNAEHRWRTEGREIDVWLEDLKVGIEYDGAYWHKNTLDKDDAKISFFDDMGIQIIRIREEPLVASRDLDIPVRNPVTKDDIDQVLELLSTIVSLTAAQAEGVQAYIGQRSFCDETGYKQLLLGCDKPPLERSLAANPAVADTWHVELNFPLKPSDVWIGSNTYAWFACETCGKAFKAKIHKRASIVQNVGKCKQCSSMLRGEALLKDVNPSLFSELAEGMNHKVDLSSLRPRSNRALWWRCHLVDSHVWKANVAHRSNGTGCPYCAGRRVDGRNSLSAVNPSLAARWDYERNDDLVPSNVTASSSRKVWWRCSYNDYHRFEAIIYNMARRPQACPYCSGKLVDESNSLQSIYPQIARQWHATLNSPLQASDVTCQSGKKVWWQCPDNPLHVWQSTVQRRVVRGSGCPECRAGD
jgi:hypothetical protein